MIYFITTFMLSLNQNTIMYQYSTYYNISIITKVEYHVSILFKYFNNTLYYLSFFFFQEEDGIRDGHVTGVQTCALPISFGDTDTVVGIFADYGFAVRFAAMLQLGSSIPLGIYAATVYARQQRLGIRVPGPVIAL